MLVAPPLLPLIVPPPLLLILPLPLLLLIHSQLLLLSYLAGSSPLIIIDWLHILARASPPLALQDGVLTVLRKGGTYFILYNLVHYLLCPAVR